MLRIQFGDNRQPGIWLVSSYFTLGQDESNSLVLPDPGVSHKHAEIQERDGQFYLSDCGSEQGTWVNGERIKHNYQLRHNDHLRIGSVELVLCDSVKSKLSTEAPPPRWSLQVMQGEFEGKRFHMSGSMTFGRSQKCELCFADAELSRRHCEFFLKNDVLEVKDLASANGVYVNQQKVDACVLQAGDQVRMGSVILMVIGPKIEVQQEEVEDATVFIRPVRTSSVKKSSPAVASVANPLHAAPVAALPQVAAEASSVHLLWWGGVLLLATLGVSYWLL